VIFLKDALSVLGNASSSWFLTKNGFVPSVVKHVSHPWNSFPSQYFVAGIIVGFHPKLATNFAVSSAYQYFVVAITNLFLVGL
jgi:hypothetical protein